jgi:hypothetical protein
MRSLAASAIWSEAVVEAWRVGSTIFFTPLQPPDTSLVSDELEVAYLLGFGEVVIASGLISLDRGGQLAGNLRSFDHGIAWNYDRAGQTVYEAGIIGEPAAGDEPLRRDGIIIVQRHLPCGLGIDRRAALGRDRGGRLPFELGDLVLHIVRSGGRSSQDSGIHLDVVHYRHDREGGTGEIGGRGISDRRKESEYAQSDDEEQAAPASARAPLLGRRWRGRSDLVDAVDRDGIRLLGLLRRSFAGGRSLEGRLFYISDGAPVIPDYVFYSARHICYMISHRT